ncbi:MAG: SLC13 family permease [Bacteroidales bacterium]
MINYEGLLVILVIVFIILSLYHDWLGPGFTFSAGIAVLGVFRVVTPVEILAGFANEQIAIIVMLLLIGDIIRKSGILDQLFSLWFENANTYGKFSRRMLFMVSGFSAFMNNIPIVAIMMPYVHSWSTKNNLSPSKLLIPLSYAAILGGCATLIGTSTNLLVAGMVTDQQIIELEPLNIFDFSPVGVTMIIVGVSYILLFSHRLLPDKKSAADEMAINGREYFTEVRIPPGSKMAGLTLKEAGLSDMKGLYLIEILRGSEILSPVPPYIRLMEDDVLIFAGDTAAITGIMGGSNGMQLSQVGMYARKERTEIVEVVIPANSMLVSKPVNEANFRGRFDAAVIAVHRNGERITGKTGDVKLMTGDVLLLITGDDFMKRANDTQDIYIINRLREIKKQPLYKKLVLAGGLLLVVIAAALGVVKLFTGLLSLLLLIYFLRLSSPKELTSSIDFSLVLVIGLSLALGTAMSKSGVAGAFADAAFKFSSNYGMVGVLATIFLVTNVLGAFITNKAAVAIIFPVALSMAAEMGFDPKPFILTVAFGGAASFMTPSGYQTNLMIYGPGGYAFRDFLRIGVPLTILYMIVTVAGLIWQFDLKLI